MLALAHVLKRVGWRSFALQVAVVVAVLGAAESHMRITGNFDARQPYVRTPGWDMQFKPSPAGTPGINDTSRVSINKLGLRGEVPMWSASPRILTIGSSTTEDALLNATESWSGRLQSFIRRCSPRGWVGNGGKAGTSALHHIEQLKQLLVQLPQIDTVVMMVGLVDLLVDFRIHIPEKLPSDWDLKQSFQYLPPSDVGVLGRSLLYQATERAFDQAVARIRSAIGLSEATAKGPVDFGNMMERYRARRNAVAPEDFITRPPAMTTAIAAYRDRLAQLADVVRNHGAAPMFITQPALWRADMNAEERSRLYAGGLGGVDQWFNDSGNKWYAPGALAQMLAAYNEATMAVCAARALMCVDLARLLPREAAFFYDDFHFSQSGAALAAQVLAGRIGGCSEAPPDLSNLRLLSGGA